MENRSSNPVYSFLHWWGSELKELIPDRSLLSRSTPARGLVLAFEAGRLRLLLEKSGRSEPLAAAVETSETGLTELARLIRTKPDLPVGLRFGPQDAYVRTSELPAQAEADFGRILDLDMERTTPFRAADVLTAHCVAPDLPAPAGKRVVRQVIVKRSTIDPLLSRLRDFGIEPDFADSWAEDRKSGLPLNLLADMRLEGQLRGPSALSVWGVVFALLAVSAITIPIIRNQNALEALSIRTAAARTEAATVRQAFDASQAASAQITAMGRLLKSRVPVARIVEELTAVLPDTAWISDLRIEGDVVEFTGFANSAASLVGPLENSPLFMQASLTSPVVLDSAEDKERFSMRLRVEGVSTAPSGDGGPAEAEGQTGMGQ